MSLTLDETLGRGRKLRTALHTRATLTKLET
jgi:hypothetical protein